MSIGRVLKYLAGALVILVVALVVVAMTVDFNDYKPEIRAQVKQATGRDLTIEGDVELALSLTPALGVSGVRFANADWGSRPAMATVDRFEVQVALIPLISGTIDVRKVVLRGADLLLETNADGQANYVFETAPTEPSAAAAGSAPAIPVLRHVTIENSRVTYRDGATDTTATVAVDTMSLQSGEIDKPVALSLSGSYNGNPVALSGTLGSRTELLASGQPYPVALALEAGGAKIGLKGTLESLLDTPQLELDVTAEGESLAGLSPLVGAPVPPLGPYSATARVSGSPAATVKLADLAVKVGGSDLSGAVSADLRGRAPFVEGTLKATRIDIADFVKPGGPGSAAPAAAADDGRVFPDTPLPLDGLKAVDATVEIAIETLLAAVEAKNVQIGLYLKGGDLRVAPVTALASGGEIDARLRLNAAAGEPALDAVVSVSKFDAGKFLADMAVTDLLEGRFNVNVNLKGSGRSVRAIMAGLNGRTQVAMGTGRMKSTALETFIGGPTKMLADLFSGKQGEYTVINCMVSQFDIQGGLATSKALLFDTEYATISGKGTVNLATEALDMEIDPQPKSATVNTAVPVVVTGTLAEPSYGVNKLSAARKVGGLLGGFVFPPALIIGLAETGTGEDSPCLTGGSPAAKQASPKPEKKEEENVITQPLRAIEKGVGGALKKLFGN